jgi:hypothetical protein
MKTIWGTSSGEVTPAVADTCDSGNDATCNSVDGQTEACGASAAGCTLGSQTCAGGGWGACTGNTCADFSVGTPAGRCTATATAGEPNDNTCAFPVCPAGYYVSTCTLHIITAYGSCVFNGPDGADPTQANITVNKPLQGAGSTCAFTACSCRYDGF